MTGSTVLAIKLAIALGRNTKSSGPTPRTSYAIDTPSESAYRTSGNSPLMTFAFLFKRPATGHSSPTDTSLPDPKPHCHPAAKTQRVAGEPTHEPHITTLAQRPSSRPFCDARPCPLPRSSWRSRCCQRMRSTFGGRSRKAVLPAEQQR